MKLKWWLFKNYVWIGAVIAIVIAILLHSQGWPTGESIAGLTTIVGYFHFLQNQRLEEMRLFKELFTEFNGRYDKLNEHLAKVRRGEWSLELERRVVDYFNLCAEEYLFYQQGYLYPEVWQSWRKGMEQYVEVERVRKLWEEEVRTDSYYGLTLV